MLDEDELPDVVRIAGTDAAVEADRILAGEFFDVVDVAGLQFYGYDKPGLDGLPVRPLLGQRLGLVRAPDNPWDADAVEVWLGNGTQLGHLPEWTVCRVAERLDAGRPLRAYCAHAGNGAPWSMRVLLVGEAVAPLPPPPEAEWVPPPGYDHAPEDIPF